MSTALSPTSLVTPDFALTASGQELDLSPETFGTLTDSSDVAFDAPALRERMARDGYLFLPGLLYREEVLEARRVITDKLMDSGVLKPGTDPMECRPADEVQASFIPEVARDNAALHQVLYDGPMMAMWERFFGESVRHFDFTWFRAVTPGLATPPHTDAVYMNRGTHDLYTAWTPMGDVPLEQGTLMVLEGSHRHQKLRENYSQKDVDAFCENRELGRAKSKGGGHIRNGGWLSNRPATLRERLGGRWLTTNFRAGDVLVFSIFTVHCSLDNHSDRVRLTSDSRYQRASEPADERWIGPNPIGHGPNAKRGLIC